MMPPKILVIQWLVFMTTISAYTAAQGLQDITEVDTTYFTFNKGAKFYTSIKDSRYEVSEIAITFSPIWRRGKEDDVFKEVKDSIWNYICHSCQESKKDSPDAVNDPICMGKVSRFAAYGFFASISYEIIIQFPLQKEAKVTEMKEEIDRFLSEVFSKRKSKVHWGIRSSVKKKPPRCFMWVN